MSLEQKVSQMLLVGVPKASDIPIHAGGVIFLGNQLKHLDEVRPRVEALQARAAIPLLIAADVEGGKVNRLSRHPALSELPSAYVMAQGTVAQTQAWGAEVARVMRSLGLNCNLAPVLDLAEEGWMQESERSFGGDAEHVAAHGRAFSLGLRSGDVAAFGKHFPGYGAVKGNSDHELLTIHRTPEQFAHHTEPFHMTGDALTGVMLTNIAFQNYGQVPAPFAPEIVRLAHERDWLVMTDDLAIPVLTKAAGGDAREVIKSAFLSGTDLLLTTWPIPSEKAPDYVGALTSLVEERPELIDRVDESVRRILEVKRELRLLSVESPAGRSASDQKP